MKIIYTLPGVQTPHGGYRIVLEHLTRLKKLGYDVALYVEHGPAECKWYDHDIFLTSNWKIIKNYDCVVIGSPHSIRFQDYITSKQKCFLFMQMDERKFRPTDSFWKRQCEMFYKSKFPIIHGSHWGEKVCRDLGRKGEMFYIGNGVNFDHFPIENCKKDGKTILLEGASNTNPAKDIDKLALKVAYMLRQEGYTILGYGFNEIGFNDSIFNEYHVRPSLKVMNELYSEAAILLKSTRYDARALSPVEAMTKGTVTVRAIVEGDDDLKDGANCLRSEYDFGKFSDNALKLLEDHRLRERLSNNCKLYVRSECNWDTIIPQLEKILLS